MFLYVKFPISRFMYININILIKITKKTVFCIGHSISHEVYVVLKKKTNLKMNKEFTIEINNDVCDYK